MAKKNENTSFLSKISDYFKSGPERKKAAQAKKELAIDRAVLDTNVRLDNLKDRYKVMLNRQLMTARYNQKQGIPASSDNYSKIGVAYYSLSIIDTAKKRMQSISSSRELYNCMNELNATLGAVNGLNGKIGNLDTKGVVKELGRMNTGSGGASADLVKALSILSGLETGGVTDVVPIDSLVSRDVIEGLINGEDVNTYLNRNAGIETMPENVMDLMSDIPGVTMEKGQSAEMVDIESSMQNIMKMMENI